MTIELVMLAWTLVLAFIQILLFDMARTAQYGLKWNTGARDEEMPPLHPRAQRLQRAQANLFETLPIFIGVVLIAHVTGRGTELSAVGAQVYFWARVAYVPLYAFGVRGLRSLAWLISIAGLGLVAAPILVP
ncbi:MAG: MAPEG family protein [Phenylobacterium sp.]|nr:MAPEG family protein [Phenylobacterium sp.]